MPWFRCLMRGENILLREDEHLKLMGFYTTRCVDVTDAASVESAVLSALKTEEFFVEMPAALRNKEAVIIFEEIVQLSRKPRRKGKGLTFFPMGPELDAAKALQIERAYNK